MNQLTGVHLGVPVATRFEVRFNGLIQWQHYLRAVTDVNADKAVSEGAGLLASLVADLGLGQGRAHAGVVAGGPSIPGSWQFCFRSIGWANKCKRFTLLYSGKILQGKC